MLRTGQNMQHARTEEIQMPTKFQLGNLMRVHSEDQSISATKIIKIDLKRLDVILGTRLI
jgi:hypothetical protein